MPNIITEDQIEKATVALLGEYGYKSLDCFTDRAEDAVDRSGRQTKSEVVLFDRLVRASRRMNPGIPESILGDALLALVDPRPSISPLAANKEIYGLIRSGIPVEYEDPEGRPEHGIVKVIDFDRPEENEFLAVSQLWIKGEFRYRRPDLILYVNGLPLVWIELKNSNVSLKNAYDDNFVNYRADIPALFVFNGLCVLSNAVQTRIGSSTASWEFFFPWLRPDDEREKVNRSSVERDGTSLERLVRGLFPKERLLDYLENFVLYYGEKAKIVAQNHQFIGVNKAIASFEDRAGKEGRLGVFWHTQGSGKSFSMIFLARKIASKYAGNYTFLIITDREDLDGQIYRSFLETGTVTKSEAARPRDSEELRSFLGRNLRVVFTLIQKFRYDKGKEYPVLSTRDDIIVIVDEAHRTQYASLAENMRSGLPNAQFYAFTGTPLLGTGEHRQRGKTYEWFGDYVSEYNFQQSIDDGATVPLFYQKRVPEVLIQNESLGEEFYELLDDEEADEEARDKLEREYSKELEVIKRDDRLETIAADIAFHFPRRGYLGKGMMIAVDKYTAVKMYDKVQVHWKKGMKRLVGEIAKTHEGPSKETLKQTLDYMRSVEMAVVVSEDAGENERFAKQGLDIKPHRQKMNALDANGHDIEYRFKDPKDNLQLVFVCAMWLTGFDVPSLSTLYLDKPMKGHTLMQAIARANRVCGNEIRGVVKENGEIVDYYNVFRSMRKALADYAISGDEEGKEEPVEDKANLIEMLRAAIAEGLTFCSSVAVDLESVTRDRDAFKKIGIFAHFADTILAKDETWKEFKVYENTISSLYEAAKPEALSIKERPTIAAFQYLRGVIESIVDRCDIEKLRLKVGQLLDQSIVASNSGLFARDGELGFPALKSSKALNLGELDFDKLRAEFKSSPYRNIELVALRDFIEKKLAEMLKENAGRTGFIESLQRTINEYNAGGTSTEDYFDELMRHVRDMKDEAERHVKEGLTEDELELYDILKKPKMTKAEEIKVKNAAKHLLHRLKEEEPRVLVKDWFKEKQAQECVKLALEKVLDSELPDSYDRALFTEKSRALYELILNYSAQGQKWTA
jgi:type I restriction enzyme, R subunit